MAILLRTDKPPKPVFPTGRTFSLEELYSLIDCDTVDFITLPTGALMWVDDNGLLMKKPLNITASQLAGSTIVGHALITDTSEVE